MENMQSPQRPSGGSGWSQTLKSLTHLTLWIQMHVIEELTNHVVTCMICIHKLRVRLSVQTIPKTLSPQWREQFDLHLYEETGGVLELSVWDRDTGRRDDFIGRSVNFN